LTQTGIAPKTTTEVVRNFNQKEKIMNNRNYRFVKTGEETVRKIRSLIIPVVMFLALCAVAPHAFAQELYQPPTTVELEEFRQDLDQMIEKTYQYRETLRQNKFTRETLEKQSKTNSAPALAQIRQQLREMNYEDLAVLHKAFTTHFPEWREVPQALGKIANKIRKTSGKTSGIGETNAPNAITPDNCQDAFNAAPSFTDYAAVSAAAIAADGLQNVIPPPFNAAATAVYIAAAEGALVAETLNNIYDRCSGDQALGNLQTSVDNLQNSQTDIINTVNAGTTTIVNNDNTNKDTVLSSLTTNTTTINNAITNAKTDIVNNDNTNKTAIISNAATNTTTITSAVSNAQTSINNTSNANAAALNTAITSSTNSIVANDNANKTAIINNANANTTTLNTAIVNAQAGIVNNANANATALQDALLRSQIEADLATESNGVKVAWYMTPTANGGKLDLVQQIVTLTLANIQAAGGSIGNAQSFLTKANQDKAAGNFKSAYDNYRRAYKAAAN